MLGAGGLVRAYSHTAKIALDAGKIITMAPCNIYSVSVDYSIYERFNLLLAQFGAEIKTRISPIKLALLLPCAKIKAKNLRFRFANFATANIRLTKSAPNLPRPTHEKC